MLTRVIYVENILQKSNNLLEMCDTHSEAS